MTKATTFYRHFPSRDDLVRAHLEEVHRDDRAGVDAITAGEGDPRDAILAIFGLIAEHSSRDPAYRGCPFINAAAEYPDPSHPVGAVITAHRHWLQEQFRALLAHAEHPRPAPTAHMLVLLWDGAAVGGYLDDPGTVHTAVRHAARTLITSTAAP